MTTIANVADQATAARFDLGSSQKQTAFAGRTGSVWATVAYHVWRWYHRTRIEAALRHKNDRTLRDIGFEPETDLRAQILTLLDQQYANRQRQAQVYRELMALSDAELDDLGIKRRDIGAIARDEYPFQVEAANPSTKAVGRPVPANEQRHIAAA